MYTRGRCVYVVLFSDDGDRLQSPKRRVSFIKDRRWIMCRKFVISIILPVFCIGLKAEFAHKGKKADSGCLRSGCLFEYLDL
jgi:hypothetical protein